MNEELSLSIQAKILPLLEGKEGLASEIADVESRIMGSRNFPGSDRKQQQQLQQIISGYAAQQGDVASDLDAIIKGTGGNVSKQDLKEMFLSLNRLERENVKTEQRVVSDITKHSGLLDEALGGKLTSEAREGFEYYREQIKKAKDSLSEWREEIDKAEKSTGNLFRQLKSAGVFALGGMVVNSALSYAMGEASIRAKGLTSFDLMSPMGSYLEATQYDLFKETTQRRMDYTAWGKGLGGAGGLLGGAWLGAQAGALGGPIGIGVGAIGGAIAGVTLGGSLGDGLAGLENTEQTGEVQHELKYNSQIYQIAKQLVESARGYENLRRQQSIRFGGDLGGSSGFGYSAMAEIQMKEMFGSELGAFDDELYKEQLAFGRANGLNPQEIFRLNRIGRMTGQRFGVAELTEAKGIAERTFGENADSHRIIDVLLMQKDILKELLNVNVDPNNVTKYSQLATLIMGADSPYGKQGDLARKTLSGMATLGEAGNTAERALLMRALGGNGLFGEHGFLMRERKGIFDPENFEDIMNTAKNFARGSEVSAQILLRNKSMPMAVRERLIKLISGDDIKGIGNLDDVMDRFRAIKRVEPDIKGEELQRRLLFKGAGSAATAYQMQEERVTNARLEAARNFRDTILDAQEKSVNFWDTMSKSADVQKKLIETMQKEGVVDSDNVSKKIGTSLWSGDAPPEAPPTVFDLSSLNSNLHELSDTLKSVIPSMMSTYQNSNMELQ